MGNRVRADITIGGRLNACCVPEFLETLADDDVYPRDVSAAGEPPDRPRTPADLDELLALIAADDRKTGHAPRGATFGDDEVNYGNLDGIKIFCHKRGLPYHYDCADGSGEWDADDEWWTPEQGSVTLCQLVNSGSAIPLADLRTGWKDKTGAEIAAWYDARTVEPGPMEVVALPAGQACPGCLAEAVLPGSALPQDFAGPALDPEGTEAA